MADTKYGKYVIGIPLESGEFGPLSRLTGEEHYASDFSILFAHISAPCLMEDAPHSHDFDMYLYFLGVKLILGIWMLKLRWGLARSRKYIK